MNDKQKELLKQFNSYDSKFNSDVDKARSLIMGGVDRAILAGGVLTE